MKVENIEELITLSYELEGLLHLAMHRGDDTPTGVWALVHEKINAINESLPVMDTEQPSTLPADDDIEEYDTDTNTKAQDITDVNPEEGNIPTSPLPVSEIITEPEASETTVSDTESDDQELLPLVETTGSDNRTDTEPQNNPEPQTNSDDALSIVETPENISVCTDISDNDSDRLSVQNEAPDIVPASLQTIHPQASIDSPAPVALDLKLARDNSRNLRKAFSLNDRYRFRRELFGGNDADMSDAINLVEAMSTYEEAADYFYGDLGWKPDNDDVDAFMTIVRNHFGGR